MPGVVVTGTAGLKPAVLTRHAVWVMLGTLVPTATSLAALALWPLWHAELLLPLGDTALFAAMLAIGIVLLAEPGQAANGSAMAVSAVLTIVTWANEWHLGPLPLISKVLGDLWLPVGSWALYRYPNSRLSRGDQWMFGLLLGSSIASSWLLVLISRPEWHQFPAGWWPTLYPDRVFYENSTRAIQVISVGMAILYCIRWYQRLRLAKGAERRFKVPIAISAIVTIGVNSASPIGQYIHFPDPTLATLYAVTTCSVLVVPIAFLVAVVRHHLARTDLVQVLIRVSGNASREDIATALRSGLHDPSLYVLYWSESKQRYINEANQEVVGSEGRLDNVVAEIRSSSDAKLALVVADPALEHDLDLVRAAVTAVRFSLENALLLETVRNQLAELQASSSRIAQEGVAERRRIQRDLHDGIQGQLAALGPRLGALKATTTDQQTAERIADIRNALTKALTDLRGLARGIRPDVLNLGLAAAVKDLCRSHALPATINLPTCSIPDTAEYTAFMTISEAVTNCLKHARAQSLSICGFIQGGFLTIVVKDDGCGGALPGKGTGLINISDRVTALSGQVQIYSPQGKGTQITMRIPCV
ncbi:sensor histidine kinase [Streptomyces mirabilis]|uniref:sensor histidine kinase n=1 Tax=Streptomyces mirabilis TaxID=68239 RepID=UPI0036A105E2